MTTCLPLAMALQDHLLGDAVAADQFDDDVDFRIIDHGEGIVGDGRRRAGDLLARSRFLSATTVMRIGRPARRVISSHCV